MTTLSSELSAYQHTQLIGMGKEALPVGLNISLRKAHLLYYYIQHNTVNYYKAKFHYAS